MWNLFRKKRENRRQGADALLFVDIYGESLAEGDLVEALRYNLGDSRIVQGEAGWEYESVETGERVSYLRMIDAATKQQKVRRLGSSASGPKG